MLARLDPRLYRIQFRTHEGIELPVRCGELTGKFPRLGE